MSTATNKTLDPGLAAIARDRVHVGESPTGTWIVSDEADRRGGYFQDRRAAFRFIRDEFGRNAEILARPPLTALAAKRLSNSHRRGLSRRAHGAR